MAANTRGLVACFQVKKASPVRPRSASLHLRCACFPPLPALRLCLLRLPRPSQRVLTPGCLNAEGNHFEPAVLLLAVGWCDHSVWDQEGSEAGGLQERRLRGQGQDRGHCRADRVRISVQALRKHTRTQPVHERTGRTQQTPHDRRVGFGFFLLSRWVVVAEPGTRVPLRSVAGPRRSSTPRRRCVWLNPRSHPNAKQH